jgi:ornithine cyclodeaminase/alanine dehydrogenase-like protein (mu-crystallin family)
VQPIFVDERLLHELVPMEAAVHALEETFREGGVVSPDRQHLHVGDGDLLLMPAWSESAAGVKLVSVAPDNPSRGLPLIHGLYVLLSKPSLQPVALFDAAALTALRTAAVSAVATRHLAEERAARLVVFGAGVQARSHIAAIRAVRPIDSVVVVSRTAARAETLVSESLGREVQATLGTPEDVADADIVCTCTTSDTPLFAGSLVKEGAHVNAVGTYRPGSRELDDELLQRADIYVDTRNALQESGDLVIPLREKVIAIEDVNTLTELITGQAQRPSAEVSVFKSVGAAFEDLAVAAAASAKLS